MYHLPHHRTRTWTRTANITCTRAAYLWQRNPAGACFELTIPISPLAFACSPNLIRSFHPLKVSENVRLEITLLCLVLVHRDCMECVCINSTQFMELVAVSVNKVSEGKLSAGLVLDTTSGGQRCHEAKYGSTLLFT